MATLTSDPIERLVSLRDDLKDAWVTFDRSTLEFFKNVFARVEGKDKTILEVGSGFGMTCLLFGLLGAKEAYGVELVARAVASANRMRDSLDPSLPVFFKQHNAANPLPYPENKFDVLLLIEVISHVVCSDFPAFMSDMARVVKPGGIIYVSDGNNGYSPYRRKVNQAIWNRFENGPPTRDGETVHTHRIEKSYLEMRREISRQAAPQLSAAEHDVIARNTFCFTAPEVESAAKTYAAKRSLATQAKFKKGICPIHPIDNMYIEKLFDPFKLCDLLRAMGFKITLLTTRRKLPGQKFLDAFPRLAMFISNGFVIMAEKT